MSRRKSSKSFALGIVSSIIAFSFAIQLVPFRSACHSAYFFPLCSLIPLEDPAVTEGFPKPPEDYTLTIEVDVFSAPFEPLVLAEVEFFSTEEAEAFLPPDWFGEEVTYCQEYHNSYLAMSNVELPDPEL